LNPTNAPSPSFEEFTEIVHDALNHLYDSPYLQSHPLHALFDPTPSPAMPASQSLRRLLLDAIRAMRPKPGTPAQSVDWRAYRILELRYLEGMTPTDVMAEIALSRSQFFREQARIVEAVTSHLWEQIQQRIGSPKPQRSEENPHESRQEMASAETARLSTQALWEPVELSSLLDELQPLLLSLGKVKEVPVHFGPMATFVIRRADRVMLRQAILNVVSFALDMARGDMARGGEVMVTQVTHKGSEGVQIACQAPSALAHAPLQHEPVQTEPSASHRQGDRQGVGLEICQQLMRAMGGELLIERNQPGQWDAYLLWPIAQSPTLLVVDDNSLFADLLARYLSGHEWSGHEWKVISAGDSVQAQRILDDLLPTVILLDVMMPKQDGWEFLRMLKLNARMKEIPVIICSVLNEPELALMLGAVAYLPKPLSQQAFLQELTRWSHPAASPRAAGPPAASPLTAG
jgi:CheY-like chemotaxis protein